MGENADLRFEMGPGAGLTGTDLDSDEGDHEKEFSNVDLVVPSAAYDDSPDVTLPVGNSLGNDDDDAAVSLTPENTEEKRLQHLVKTHPWAADQLAKGLDSHRASSRRQTIGPVAFAILSRLLSTALEVCGDRGEYRTAHTLMHMCSTYHTVVATSRSDPIARAHTDSNAVGLESGDDDDDDESKLRDQDEQRHYLQHEVKRPSFLDHDEFWRDIFFDSVAREKIPWDLAMAEAEGNPDVDVAHQHHTGMQAVNEDTSLHETAHHQIVFSQLTTLAYSMLQWDIGIDRVRAFVSRQCEVNRLSPELKVVLLDSLGGFHESVVFGKNGDREKHERKQIKARWLRERKGSWEQSQKRRSENLSIGEGEGEGEFHVVDPHYAPIIHPSLLSSGGGGGDSSLLGPQVQTDRGASSSSNSSRGRSWRGRKDKEKKEKEKQEEESRRAELRADVQNTLMNQLLFGLTHDADGGGGGGGGERKEAKGGGEPNRNQNKDRDGDADGDAEHFISPDALVASGVDHMRKSEWKQALYLLDYAVKLYPEHIGARVNRAVTYTSLERPADALIDLDIAKGIDVDGESRNAAVSINRAIVLDILGRYAEAEEERKSVNM